MSKEFRMTNKEYLMFSIRLKENNCYSNYIYFDATFAATIEFLNYTFEVSYTNGDYFNNDYSLPMNNFTFYESDSRAIELIAESSESEIFDEENDLFDDVKEEIPELDSREKIFELYQFIHDSTPSIHDFNKNGVEFDEDDEKLMKKLREHSKNNEDGGCYFVGDFTGNYREIIEFMKK